ncbi:hypothetical protein CDD81_3436 [Ophiocordyceps australis]|uniref:Extracellular membrane protein CFEM domain-containing protein n=1 Tax=Ophiocordyceps australis TaxID=1399860 RepID=A0A2C5XJM8_9HYPO|nr:hypothetical protein CDD81_3436 [Ophiocordyceps australis]
MLLPLVLLASAVSAIVPQTAMSWSSSIPHPHLMTRGLSGQDCFTTKTITTSTCPKTTSSGHISTLDCTPTVIATSDCAPGFTCTVDASHEDICMKRIESLDTGGIIVAALMGLGVAACLGALAFMCVRDRKLQRQLAARSAAQALKRAETKRMRSAESRTPLIRSDGAPGSPNPFQEGPRQ